nr:reverse transcriptase domain-containing protein [Tanacetum cinerariifolium]
MATTIEQQVALDEALVPSTKRLRIGRSNFRLPSDIQSKEPTLQVVYDVLHGVLSSRHSSKKNIVDLEAFREMLHISPRVSGQSFDEIPFEEEILDFLWFLGHSTQIKILTDALLHQIRAEIREEFRTSSGPSNSGGNPPPVTIHTWLKRFNKQKPHSFEKATAPVDAKNWISHIEKIFDVMGCEDAFKTRLAVYKFDGNALAWWKAYKQAKSSDVWLITVTWVEFKKLFFLQFFPRAEQKRLKMEYHSIRQTSTETSTEFMQRFLRLAGFLGAAAGTEEEQAKNFQWGLRRSTLNHLMCMSYTDVAQVANAARNYEILHERDDDDTERPDKRQKSGDRHQLTSQQSSHRNHGHNNDCHGSDRRSGGDNHRSNNNYSGSNNRKLVAITPIKKEKKVRFIERGTSSSNIPKQTDSLRTKDSSKPLLTSIGVNTTTSANGSKPSGNTKKNRISRPPSSNQKNNTLRAYYEEVRILHQTFVARTPQQNGVNRTLVEAARTIKPNLSYLHVFDALCYPINDIEDLEPTVSTSTPSSATIDQDAPSTSTSQTTLETSYPIIPLGVEEADHDIEVLHMDNNPYVDFLIQEPSFEESSSQKFSKGTDDPTLFIRREGKDILLVQIYVDDIIFASTKLDLYESFSKIMCSKFKMSMMGKLSFFLRLQISKSPRGIFLNQSKYALESLKKYGIETCDPLDTLMVKKSKLDEDPLGKAVDLTRYRRMIGTLIYLTSSRPDLVFAVCMCARYQAKPTKKHLYAVKRIFRYLRGTINIGLWYLKDSCIALTAFADADHAGCQDTKKCTFRSMQLLETQQVVAHDEKWVPSTERVKISSTNVRLETNVPQKKRTFQVVIDVIKNSTCFKAFIIIAEVFEIFMQQLCRRVVKKNVMISVANNIILDPDVALGLSKSISIIKAEEEEAARQVHATHSRIVTECVPEPVRRRPLGIDFRDTSQVSKKVSSDPSQKFKGRIMERMEEQLGQFIDQLTNQMNNLMNNRRPHNRRREDKDEESEENSFGNGSSSNEQSIERPRQNQIKDNRCWESEVFEFKEVPENKKVSLIATKLRGRVSAWWQQIKLTRERVRKSKITSWQKMNKCARANFIPHNYQRLMYQRLQNLKQVSKSVEDYTTEFYQLISRNDIQEREDQLLSRYIGGLRVQIMDSFHMFDPMTLSDAFQRALAFEKQNQRVGSSSSPVITYVSGSGNAVSCFAPNQAKAGGGSLNKYEMESCDLVDTPMVEKCKLDEDTQEKAIDPTHYRGMVGTLMYLTSSRPDLIHVVYFVDVDHVGYQDTRRSTSESMQLLGDRLVSCPLDEITTYRLWSGFNKIPMYYDNKSAIALCCNNVHHSRSKHIDIKYHFIKEQVGMESSSFTLSEQNTSWRTSSPRLYVEKELNSISTSWG